MSRSACGGIDEYQMFVQRYRCSPNKIWGGRHQVVDQVIGSEDLQGSMLFRHGTESYQHPCAGISVLTMRCTP